MSFIRNVCRISVLLGFIAPIFNFSIIYDAQTFIDPNNQTWVTFFSDAHIDQVGGAATFKQVDDLKQVLPTKLFEAVIVEDMSSYTGENPLVKGYFKHVDESEEKERGGGAESLVHFLPRPNTFIKIDKQKKYEDVVNGSVIEAVSKLCVQLKKPVVNVEMRFMSSISKEAKAPVAISCKQVWQDWFEQLKELEAAAAAEKNQIFQGFYRKVIAEFRQEADQYFGDAGCLMATSNETISAAKLRASFASFHAEGKLMDGKILQALRDFMKAEKEHILIACGQEHTEKIMNLLVSAGWKNVLDAKNKAYYNEQIKVYQTNKGPVQAQLVDIKPLDILAYCQKLTAKIKDSKKPGFFKGWFGF